MHVPLSGRVALVTGVSRAGAIGWAVTKRLLDDGASVIAAGWTPHDAEQSWGADPIDAGPIAAEKVERLAFEEADLGEPRAAAGLVEATVDRFGGIDIVVAAHARSSKGDLFDVSIDELDACWAINARASLLLVRALAEAREDTGRGPGRAVLFTSGQHIAPMDGEIAYALSKGAIHQMTASLANAVVDGDITVNAINPGPVDTGWAPPDLYRQIETGFPAGRWATPHDVANIVAWLVGPESGWVTGQVIDSEGGLRRWAL